jgi:hypothetical protein
MGLLDRWRDKPTPPDNQKPRGTSGRGHTEGFLDLEETNVELQHPRSHEVYDKMYRTDGDIRQVVQLSSNPIASGTWTVVPYGEEEATDKDREAAKLVEWALFEGMQPDLFGHLRTALPVLIRSGFAPFEVAWHTVDAQINGKAQKVVLPRTLALRLPRTINRFEQDEFGELTRIQQYVPVSPANLIRKVGTSGIHQGSDVHSESPNEIWMEAQNLVYYRLGEEGDNWEGISLLRPAYKHYIMKDMIERIDAIAQEREALGVPICYPPLGASDGQLDAAEEVLRNMRTNDQSYIVAPGPKSGAGAPEGQGWLFEVIGYERTGSGRDPQPSLKYHTDKIAAAFISEFMRLGHGTTGARATAQVQQDPFLMSVEALTGVVELVINKQIVAPIVAYNCPGVENPPKVQMSQVDSTSLAQLADYILKLVQIGALIPDQDLENFLRKRADLPAPNSEAVTRRKDKKDDEYRKEVVTGGGANGDAFGANAGAGEHGNKSAPVGSNGGKGQGGKGANLDREGNEVTLSWESPTGRWRWREPREHEQHVDLDSLEDMMDGVGDTLSGAVGHLIAPLAKSGGSGDDIQKAAHDVLLDYYTFGADSVYSELSAQINAPTILDRGARDRGPAHLATRADLIADKVMLAMREAKAGADLTHGNEGRSLIAAETAGRHALKQAARQHGVAAILHGRHDEAIRLSAEDDIPDLYVTYNAILDANCCGECRRADDGVKRRVDDPVRLERQPPNPHCASTAGHFNMCRCFETYTVE